MKHLNTNYRRNIAVLVAVFVFAAFGFLGKTQIVTAENETNFEPTPAKKKSTPTPRRTTSRRATPTPKKTKATPTPNRNSRTNQRTTTKAKPTPTPSRNSRNNPRTTTKAKPTPTPNRNSRTNTRTTTTRNSTTKKPTPTPSRTRNQTTRNTRTTTTTTRPTPSRTTTNRTNRTTTTTNTQTDRVLSKVIINTPSVAVRSSSFATSSEIVRARLGTSYSVVEKKSGWYRVQLANQKSGWIPASAAVDSGANNEEIYRQILAKNYKAEKSTFSEAVEVYEFLTQVQPEIKTANTAAEFGLTRLLALRYALNAIPSGKSGENPYQDFLKAQDENIVYSEPSGEWYVRSTLFWDLYSKYTNTPTGEQIAWEGAKTQLPGECEGYVNCHIFLIRMTDGEYLNYYPNGKHSTEALTNIINFLEPIAADAQEKKVYNGPTDVSDRAEFNSLITELRVIISRMPDTNKEKALQSLKKIAEGFK